MAQNAQDELEQRVLRAIRSAPHSVKLGDLARELGLSVNDVCGIIRKLRNKSLFFSN